MGSLHRNHCKDCSRHDQSINMSTSMLNGVTNALIDIFVWAPSFAMFAKFETCTGGGIISRQPRVCSSDYIKGIGRLLVSIQSLLTGVVYLFASVVSWITFIESRDSSIARKNAQCIMNRSNIR